MINKICYTYWTNSGKNLNHGFPSKDLFKQFFLISYNQSKSFFEKVEIYTDVEGYEFLKETMPEDTKFNIVDYSEWNFDKRFWNFPKLITYNMQEEPFFHIDMDSILLEKPNDLDAEILTERVRGTTIFSLAVYPLLPTKIIKHPYIVCSGLIGGKNYQIFKELFNIASEAILNKEFGDVNFNNLVAIEEIVLTHLIKRDKLNVKELNETSFIHFQGALKRNLNQKVIDTILC